ncbi:hypothetical protein D3C76_1410160 [compost metagenome]
MTGREAKWMRMAVWIGRAGDGRECLAATQATLMALPIPGNPMEGSKVKGAGSEQPGPARTYWALSPNTWESSP